jgi:acetolactate synthase-1/2/3 large subunit
VFGCSGHPSARAALADEGVELIVAAGTNLGEWSTSRWDPVLMNNSLVHIHDDPASFSRSPMARLHIQGNIGIVFSRLNERLEGLRRSGEPAQAASLQISPCLIRHAANLPGRASPSELPGFLPN